MCYGCKAVYYCSSTCQKTDWRAHKPRCKPPPQAARPQPSRFSPPKALGGVWAKKEESAKNLFIFLHGYGDSEENFVALAQRMNLPNSCCLALRGPFPLLDLGFMWFQMHDEFGVEIPGVKGELRRLEGLKHSTKLLDACINDLLAQGWKKSSIFLLAFGQSGLIAINYALSVHEALGGVFASGCGCFLPEVLLESEPSKSWLMTGTPILVTHGSSIVDPPFAEVSRQFRVLQPFSSGAILKLYRKSGIEFSSAEEMKDFYEYFAPRMVSSGSALEVL
jgi:predicted esterase